MVAISETQPSTSMATEKEHQCWSKQWLTHVPVEIRLEIYRYIFRDMKIAAYPKLMSSSRRSNFKCNVHPKVAILETCKTVLREAEHIFYEEATFNLTEHSHARPAYNRTITCLVHFHRISCDYRATGVLYRALRDKRINAPLKIRELYMNPGLYLTETEVSGSPCLKLRTPPFACQQSIQQIERLLKQLQEHVDHVVIGLDLGITVWHRIRMCPDVERPLTIQQRQRRLYICTKKSSFESQNAFACDGTPQLMQLIVEFLEKILEEELQKEAQT